MPSPTSSRAISSSNARGFFITGSDTEIGKTFVACAIVRSFVEDSIQVGVYKPVASGLTDLESSDAHQLWKAACQPGDSIERVCPQSFTQPLAPLVAAHCEDKSIDIQKITTGYEYWVNRSEFVVVEGAGGLLSPIAARLNNADLAAQLELPLVVVVPNRLGCVNQTMLVLEVARARQLPVVAVVLNQKAESSQDRSIETNLDLLRKTMNESGFIETVIHAFGYRQQSLKVNA
jgi:dethiobiotin synthetase